MTDQPNKLSYRIGRHEGRQGPRPSVGNQAEVEKFVTGTNSTQQANEDHHGEDIPHRGPAPSENRRKPTRTKWSREEYKEVMEAHYKAMLNLTTSVK